MGGQLEGQAQADDLALLVPLGAGKPVECGSHLLRGLGGGSGDLLRGRRFAPGQQVERRWDDLEEGSPARGPHRRRDTGRQFLEVVGFHRLLPFGDLDTPRKSLSRRLVRAIGVTTHLWAGKWYAAAPVMSVNA